jgi:hypothetical protein
VLLQRIQLTHANVRNRPDALLGAITRKTSDVVVTTGMNWCRIGSSDDLLCTEKLTSRLVEEGRPSVSRRSIELCFEMDVPVS